MRINLPFAPCVRTFTPIIRLIIGISSTWQGNIIIYIIIIVIILLLCINYILLLFYYYFKMLNQRKLKSM